MNAFDLSVLSFLTRFAGKHPHFDGAVISLSNSGFFRAGAIVATCWWAWFKNGEDQDNRKAREVIISTMLACLVSILFARVAVLAFPFRIRPLADPTNGLHFPLTTFDWAPWSSFPSDHAIMFFTLTTALFFISRTMGWIALLDTVFLICLPRIYLGIHYPTDILGGAVIGVGFGFLANQTSVRSFLARGAFRWLRSHPGSFYAVFFLWMYQVTVIFWDVRYFFQACLRMLRRF